MESPLDSSPAPPRWPPSRKVIVLPLTIDPERFTKRTRTRGQLYFENGCVDLIEFDEGTISALVHGTLTYSVRLKLRETQSGASVTSYSCTCPQHLRAGECKHVWGTVCAVRALGDESVAAEEDEDTFSDDPLEQTLPPRPFPRFTDPPHETFPRRSRGGKSGAAGEPATFDEFLDSAKDLLGETSTPAAKTRFLKSTTGETQLVYHLRDPRQESETGGVTPRGSTLAVPLIDVLERRRVPSGWAKPSPLDIKGRTLDSFLSGVDRQLVETLMRLDPEIIESLRYRWPGSCRLTRMPLESAVGRACLIDLAKTGRLYPAGTAPEEAAPIQFDRTPCAFTFAIVPLVSASGGPPTARFGDGTRSGAKAVRPASSTDYTLVGQLLRQRDAESNAADGSLAPDIIALDTVRAVFESGLIWVGDTLLPLDDLRALRWIALASRTKPTIPAAQVTESALRLLAFDPDAPLSLPQEFEIAIRREPPKPRLVVKRIEEGGRSVLLCQIYFDYGDGVLLEPTDETGAVVRRETEVVTRQLAFENDCIAALLRAGARRSVKDDTLDRITLAATRLPHLVETLLPEGWSIEAEGRMYRASGEFKIEVTSGIDWLDVGGTAHFDDQTLSFPRLLGALRRGSRLVPLGDGSVGVLPLEWLRRAGALAAFGELDGDEVRFRPEQAWFLDGLLAELPEVKIDEKFAEIRERLTRFEGISPLRERRSFRGKLRPYQRDALGWLRFLRDLELGGCLADDMGLGKTVQVIAHLEALRLDRELDRPALVVAPRSVIENWQREFARFAPRLEVLDASGPDRASLYPLFADRHVILMTYALVRSDIELLRKQKFDTVILDEAQAIKNGESLTAKSVRLIPTRHRLALSGTPIENHLGELWSLFEFLQPGSLGRAKGFAALADEVGDGEEAVKGEESTTEERARKKGVSIAGTVRPFILRRTKTQVAPELPPRTEQIIECPMSPSQRVLYDEMLSHYRALIRAEKEKKIPGRGGYGTGKGMQGSTLLVLRALLRLRQAACHPALLDRDRWGEGSGKLDTLLERVAELAENGQRCLVFSQFTTFLGIVRDRLDAMEIGTEYLDGKTRDRQACVDRFQKERSSTAFLISLKAGGVGLNLTAADYVFLLDPWWNPAVEAQAIDRAHRIGRSGAVIAYKLISPGTVEEKVLDLQREKQELAAAILREEDGWLRKLSAEDLGRLFS